MALNYSHCPVFPAHVSDEKLASPLRIVNGYFVDGVPEKNGEGYSGLWHGSLGEIDERSINFGRDGVDLCSSSDSTSRDIVDLLPSDPFGMDIKTTFTAITGWLEDLEVDYGEYVRSSNVMVGQEEYDLFAGWNLIWNNALKFQTFSSNVQFNEKPNVANWSFPSNFQAYEKPRLGVHIFPSSVQPDEKLNVVNEINQKGEEKEGVALAPYGFGYRSVCDVRDTVGYDNGSTSYSCEPQFGEKVEGASNFDEVPNEALAFALNYLGVKDLLSVEMVCKSLCSTVRGDPLLWMSIHIDQPLNERITDDVLLQLTNMARGKLRCLSLVECPRITDDGLGRILEANPRLTKLSVPGCTRLSIEGIVHNIKTYNSNKDVGSIKHLRIGGFYGVTHELYEELKVLLGVDGKKKLESHHKPHFYHRGNFYLPHDDDRAIDIEMCPKCEKFKLVYDCPATGCQVKDDAAQVCRACTLCIARCAQCGRCVNDTEYEETFCLELVCSDCSKQLLHYQDMLDDKIDPSRNLDGPSDASVFMGSG